MEQREKQKEIPVSGQRTDTGKKGRRKLAVCFVVFCTLLAAGGGLYYYQTQTGRGQKQPQRPEMPSGMGAESGGYITASGTTSVGITEETFELGDLDTELEIEEVFLASGDTVEQGAKILKVTEDSLQQARKELTRKVKQADLLYRQGAAESELARMEAQKTHDVTMAESEYIQTDYENSLAEAHKEIDELTEQAEDARKLYEEYYDGVYNDGYAQEYQVAEKKALYEQNEQIYWDTLKAWNIKDKEVNNPSGTGDNAETPGGSGRNSAAGGSSAASDDKSQRIAALEMMEDTYRAEKKAYEQAVEDYSNAVAKATAGLEQAKVKYELLELKLEQAQIDYEKQAAVCLAEYETKMAAVAGAQSTYDNTIQKLQDELETLENDKEEAEENLADFEEAIGDGYLYTSSKGNVVMVSVKEEETLKPDVIVLAYSDPTIMTVTAAVEQNDIAALKVGEEAVIVTEENGNLAAKITEINPVSNSNRRANVTYSVTLNFTEDAEELPANETVSVCFGISIGEYEEKMSRMQQKPEAEGGAMPGAEEGRIKD